MPRGKKTTAAAEETVVTAAPAAEAPVKEETLVAETKAPVAETKAPAAEKKAPAKKTAAKKTADKKPAAKKAPAKKPAAKKTAAKKETAETVYIQFNGAEVTSAGLIERAKAESGIKSPSKVDVYVKPEENMVYYVIDNNPGSFSLS